jgi:DNA polymerase-3 subunit epsilon/CBS domain-containing protein
MATHENATPLISLDAVVLDTETTGLDPFNARIVEMAAVRLVAGRIRQADSYRRLVRPGVSIPPAASKIHGIDDQTVANASVFAEIWPELSTFIGDRIVIGHSIGFDLAVLKRECERAGLPWHRPRSLCVRLLGEVAGRELAGYSLDQLAHWLGIEVADRHAALPDALVTARVFLGLLPKLRDLNIRTLAEAERASSHLSEALVDHHHAGWVPPIQPPASSDTERVLGRIDTYPYRHRVADVMHVPPGFIGPEATVGETLAVMGRERISSLFVGVAEAGQPFPRAKECGIVTERDVLRALAEHGPQALAMPVSRVANRPLHTVPAGALIHLAIGRMSRFKIRHLAVEDEQGRICGALSARDLLRLRAEEAVVLGDQIDQAASPGELGQAWATTPLVARRLVAEAVPGRDIAAVISREICELTRRAAVLAEAQLKAEGFGGPPCSYALAVLGSAGRGESLLALDQDNALVFAEGEPGGETDRWFERLGALVADILHEVGVPYCAGGVMARNPQWRGSTAIWRARVDDWIRRSKPQDLLSIDIFFDLLGVHGDFELANSLWRYGFGAARDNVTFVKLLAESAGPASPALSFFGTIKTVEGRIDLKKAGLFGIVSLARVLAIRHHIVARPTPERLRGLIELDVGATEDLSALSDVQGLLLDLIVRQQVEDIANGVPATNKVAVKRLSRADHERLHTALGKLRYLDVIVRDLLFAG